MVQTRDAMVGMVVANNDQPLNQEQRRAEYGRIERFLSRPDELERKQSWNWKMPSGSTAS